MEKPGPQESMFKLYWSNHKRITELALDILGSESMVLSGAKASTSFSMPTIRFFKPKWLMDKGPSTTHGQEQFMLVRRKFKETS